MTELCHFLDSKLDEITADAVLQDNYFTESDYNSEWLLSDAQLLDAHSDILNEVTFSSDIEIKKETNTEDEDYGDVDMPLGDFPCKGSPDDSPDFMVPVIKSSSPTHDEGDDDDDDDNSSSSDSSSGRPHMDKTTGLITPPEEDSYGYSSLRGGVSNSSSITSVSRPALAVRPLARHATLSAGGPGVTTVDAASTGGARSTGIRYVVQRQGNPTVYLQANASGRLRQVVPRLKRQETKTSDLACTDHFYDNAGSSEDMNGYMVYPPSPPGSSSPDNDHSMVSAAAAAGIYPGHHAYSYSSHLHRSGSNHPPPMFQSPIPQSGVLILTEEEKRTLIAEGYSIPTRLPLTKQEERNLKKIRRKIKNKISAQESRRKKKEYVETLEKKVEAYSHENSELKRRVETLENNNRSLISQLRQLQHLVGKAGSSTASTCLMVFVLFFAAFLAGPALPSSDLHQMGYAASLPRLPGPPLVPPPRAGLTRVSAQESRGLARFYSDDKLNSRLRSVLHSARSDVDSPRLLGDSQPHRPQNRRDDCSFASRIWCLFGAPCCTPDEAIFEDDLDVDGGSVIVLGNATDAPGSKPVFSVIIQNGRQYINATTV